MTEEQIELVRCETAHAATKALRRHTGSVVGAYLMVLAVIGYVLLDDGRDDRRQTRAVDAARLAVVQESCRADRAFVAALDQALVGQIRFIVASQEPPPPTIEERVAAIQEIRNRLRDVPSCQERVDAVESARDEALNGSG